MVAARIPAITNPAKMAGSELVASVINIFSAAFAVKCCVGYNILPVIPINTATASEITTHIIAILLERVNSSSLRIAINRNNTCGIPK